MDDKALPTFCSKQHPLALLGNLIGLSHTHVFPIGHFACRATVFVIIYHTCFVSKYWIRYILPLYFLWGKAADVTANGEVFSFKNLSGMNTQDRHREKLWGKNMQVVIKAECIYTCMTKQKVWKRNISQGIHYETTISI